MEFIKLTTGKNKYYFDPVKWTNDKQYVRKLQRELTGTGMVLLLLREFIKAHPPTQQPSRSKDSP